MDTDRPETVVDPAMPGRGDSLRGIVLMTAGFGAFSCADTIAKFLTADYHPVQIVWTRQLGLLAGVFLLLALNGPGLLRSHAPVLQTARGLVAVLSALTFVFAISRVPLADAIAVSFVAPFMVTLLGALALRETVGIRRWAAVIVGFAGTLVVIRPGFGVFHPAIFLVLIAAAAFAVRQVLSRHLGRTDRTATTVAYTAITATALLLVPLPFFWRAPAGTMDIALMAGLAMLAGLGEFLIIRALEIAHAVVVAPMQYSLILFGSFWGWLVFADIPDGWTWAGAAIIIASGLYTTYREARA